jgi:hypothetical protein
VTRAISLKRGKRYGCHSSRKRISNPLSFVVCLVLSESGSSSILMENERMWKVDGVALHPTNFGGSWNRSHFFQMPLGLLCSINAMFLIIQLCFHGVKHLKQASPPLPGPRRVIVSIFFL